MDGDLVGLAFSAGGKGAASLPLRLAVTDEARLRTFCARVLGPLADEKNRDLRRTLEEFIRAHGSQALVSRRLFLHRNTVRQRLRRVQELTGADLDDAEHRLKLQLALLGRAALERGEHDGASASRTHLGDAP